MVNRNFEPRFRIAFYQKDLNLALQGARCLGVALPNTATCQELFNAAVAAGGAAWDHSAMVRVLERLACYENDPAAGWRHVACALGSRVTRYPRRSRRRLRLATVRDWPIWSR